jgi:hypothetical protein
LGSTMDLAEMILHEMRQGFEAVNERLDLINGTVRRHGEQIAVLEKQAGDAEDTALRNEGKLDQMSHQFLVHRAKCPFDQGASTIPGSGDQVVLDLAKRIRRNRVAAYASLGSAITIAIIEVLPRLVSWMVVRP